MKRILGIDPGSRRTGFGIIEIDHKDVRYIISGCVRTTEKDLPTRLQQIFEGIHSVVKEYKPNEAAIEQVFMHRNANAALVLGQARGAAMCAALTQNLPIAEYSAKQIKQAIVGYGAAAKHQVQRMVQELLMVRGDIQEDAADALAVSICHHHSQKPGNAPGLR
jgi:crossover junction endodeoxyribonuclease RuvC